MDRCALIASSNASMVGPGDAVRRWHPFVVVWCEGLGVIDNKALIIVNLSVQNQIIVSSGQLAL